MSLASPMLVLLLLVLAVGGPSAHASTDLHTYANNQDSYSFAYAVDAPYYKNFHDRAEARLGQETRGRFRVALPDNRLQTVTYHAGSHGYTARVSYDHHPSFESLRESVGPIRPSPEIGQSVLEGIRRNGSSRDNRGGKEESRPDLKSSLAHPGTPSNSAVLTPTRTRPAPTRTRLAPTRTRPTPPLTRPAPTRTRPTSTRPRLAPTRTRPTPTHVPRTPAHTRLSPTRTQPTPAHPSRSSAQTRRPRPTQRRPTSPSRTPRPGTSSPNRVTPASSSVSGSRRPSPRPSPTPVPARPDTPATPESSEDFADTEDFAILNRLIHAIRDKQDTEGVEEELPHSRPQTKKSYTITDRESVRKRLEAVVHRY